GLVAKHVYARDLIIDAVAKVACQWQSETKTKLKAVDGAASKLKLRTTPVTCVGPDPAKVIDKHPAPAIQTVEYADFTLGSTDAGRAKWVESYCRDMMKRRIPVHPAFIIKRRLTGEDTEIADISADVRGMFVVIYDDMIRTGGSAISAARAYLERGAL